MAQNIQQKIKDFQIVISKTTEQSARIFLRPP